jgi:hypothetical protein
VALPMVSLIVEMQFRNSRAMTSPVKQSTRDVLAQRSELVLRSL